MGCDRPKERANLVRLAMELGMGTDSEKLNEFFNDNPKVLYRFVDFHNLLVDTANRRRIMNTTGIKKGDSISSRNCAMTEVAKMLKCR